MNWMTRKWTMSADGRRRLVCYTTPRGWVHCDECRAKLNYQYGSIAWQCRTDDLCGSCAGKKAAKELLENLRRNLAVK